MKIAAFNKDFDVSSVKCCKCKGHPLYATWDTEGTYSIAVHVFSLDAIWGEGGQRHSLAAVPPRYAALMFIVQEDGWAPGSVW